jgi:prolyl oligopeptidase
MLALFILATLLFASDSAMCQSLKPDYPATRTVGVVDTLFGVPVADPYRWLEPNDDPQVQQWTDQQNVLTRRILDALSAREKIKQQLKELWNYPRATAPSKYGKRYFYYRNDGLQNHWVLCTRESLTAEPRVLVDPNTFSEDGTKAMDWTSISSDGSMIAYGVSESGSEDAVLHVRNVVTGEELPLQIKHCKYASVAWEKDNSGFYYTRNPEPGTVPIGDENYYNKIYYHKLGADPSTDQVIYQRPDRKDFSLGVQMSEDCRTLLIYVTEGTGQTNELYYIDLEHRDQILPIVTGFKSSFSPILIDTTLYIVTREEAPNVKIMQVSMGDPRQANWRPLVPEGLDLLEGYSIINRCLVLKYLHNACSLIKVYDLNGKYVRDIQLPAIGSVGSITGKWDDPEMFFDFSSYVHPPEVFRYDFATDKLTLFYKSAVKFDPTKYETKQVWYPSKDGVKISMFIVSKKGLKLDGNNPALLYGYGGFSVNASPSFSSTLRVWLDHGGVFAEPNLRGGNEYGEKWHAAGMLDKKQNVFDDFIAAADWLVSNRYTSRDKLAIEGGSNGGLLVGAVMVQRPDLCKAVLCEVPLLDMIRYQQFLIARLWVPEYGSSENPDQFKYLLAYSPYHNVKPNTHYPATLIKAGESDGRVHPSHARKMAALLQKVNIGDSPILLWVERKAGHGQGKPISMQLDDVADNWAFIFWQLGVTF